MIFSSSKSRIVILLSAVSLSISPPPWTVLHMWTCSDCSTYFTCAAWPLPAHSSIVYNCYLRILSA
eukprot:596652-Pleurochrysis_carterae.AAC.2